MSKAQPVSGRAQRTPSKSQPTAEQGAAKAPAAKAAAKKAPGREAVASTVDDDQASTAEPAKKAAKSAAKATKKAATKKAAAEKVTAKKVAAKKTPAKKVAEKKATAATRAPKTGDVPQTETPTPSQTQAEARDQIHAEAEPPTPTPAETPAQEPKHDEHAERAEQEGEPAPTKAKPAPTHAAEPKPKTTELEQRPLTRTLQKIRKRPGYAAEYLALAAVSELGPQARDWANDIRDTYPAATPEGLARLATRRFTRLAALSCGAVTSTGPVGGAAEFAALAWTQARLVLHLAAVYGHDPTDPERAVDLLVLTHAHPTVDAARAAIRSADEEGTHRLVPMLTLRTQGWGVRRLVARLLPGAGILLAAASATANTERLAARAIQHYRAASKAATQQDKS